MAIMFRLNCLCLFDSLVGSVILGEKLSEISVSGYWLIIGFCFTFSRSILYIVPYSDCFTLSILKIV